MRFFPEREVIGPPDCPLFYRYTIRPWSGKSGQLAAYSWKLMVHRFLAQADDRDVHDHPRSFWTFVLRGYYDDLGVCRRCSGTKRRIAIDPDAKHTFAAAILVRCDECDSDGMVVRERMKAGMIRHRSAEHAHRTKVGPKGCWTLVLMGPLEREWGFWRGERWWQWKAYEEEFGFAMRCEDE